MASSFVPGPVATTVPFCGFSFAVSGIMIPEAVVVSAANGSITTRSAKGLMLIVLMFCVYSFERNSSNYAKLFFGLITLINLTG
jgi:hypothetical protein